VNWNALLAPAGAVTAILRTQNVKEPIATEGGEVAASSPEELASHIRAEMAGWAKV